MRRRAVGWWPVLFILRLLARLRLPVVSRGRATVILCMDAVRSRDAKQWILSMGLGPLGLGNVLGHIDVLEWIHLLDKPAPQFLSQVGQLRLGYSVVEVTPGALDVFGVWGISLYCEGVDVAVGVREDGVDELSLGIVVGKLVLGDILCDYLANIADGSWIRSCSRRAVQEKT